MISFFIIVIISAMNNKDIKSKSPRIIVQSPILPVDIVINNNDSLFIADIGWQLYQVNFSQKEKIQQIKTKINPLLIQGVYGSMAFDQQDNLFFVGAQKIFKRSQKGELKLIAGQDNPTRLEKTTRCSKRSYTPCPPPQRKEVFADGQGTQAKFDGPTDIAIDKSNSLYIADTGNHAIRKVSPTGFVSTLAGDYDPGSKDGLGRQARFNSPLGLAVDSHNTIYVTEDNNAIRRITPQGHVSTYLKGVKNANDSTGFYFPHEIAIDKNDNLYIADARERIYKITPSGKVIFLAGSTEGQLDGKGKQAKLEIRSMAVNSVGEVFVLNSSEYSLRKVTRSGEVITVLNFQ